MELVVVSAIWLGAVIFGFVYMDASAKIGPGCDLDDIDKARYAYWTTFDWSSLKTIKECKAKSGKYFSDLDINGDG